MPTNVVDVPTAPALGRIKGVEILHVGEWDISTGTTQVTLDDLHAIVAATDCPAVRNATLKPGHKRPLMQGDPSLGYVANLRVEDDYKLVGDWCAMPGWLVQADNNGDSVIAGAYADRSAEWSPYTCQLGHTHPCVLGAVALLGVEHPGIGTLESLHDLYSTPPTPAAAAAAKEAEMPKDKANAAAVSTDDVRRAYYEAPDTDWDEWIVEMQLDPLQLITVDDRTGKHYRVPVSVTGEDAFAFGAKTEVRVQYVDAAVQAAAVAAGKRVLFASRAESRPTTPRLSTEPGQQAATGGPNQEGAGMDPAKLREALGLTADASDEQVSAALAENDLVPAPAPVTPPTAPAEPGGESLETAVNAAVEKALTPVLAELGRTSQELADIKAASAKDEKAKFFDTCVAEGRLAPADRADWEKNYDEAPAVTARILQARARGSVVPVATATGYTGDGEAGVFTSEEEAFLSGIGGVSN